MCLSVYECVCLYVRRGPRPDVSMRHMFLWLQCSSVMQECWLPPSLSLLFIQLLFPAPLCSMCSQQSSSQLTVLHNSRTWVHVTWVQQHHCHHLHFQQTRCQAVHKKGARSIITLLHITASLLLNITVIQTFFRGKSQNPVVIASLSLFFFFGVFSLWVELMESGYVLPIHSSSEASCGCLCLVQSKLSNLSILFYLQYI